jgi:hypothetical protein
MGSRVLESELDAYHGYGLDNINDPTISLKGRLSGASKEKTAKETERRKRRNLDLTPQMYHIVNMLKDYADSGTMNRISQDPHYTLTEEVRKNASRLILRHDTIKCNGWLWMPNAGKLHKRTPPTGFAFATLEDRGYPTRLYGDLFNASKFFYGTLAVRVDPLIRTTADEKSPLDVVSSLTPQALAQKLLESKHLSEAQRQLKPGRGAYMGVYAHTSRDYGPWAPSIWVVVQCGNEDISQQFYKFIIDNCSRSDEEDSHATWEHTLFQDKKVYVQQFREKIVDTRMQCVVGILRALGFETIETSNVVNMDHVDTMTNCFGFDRHTNSYVYYAGCTPIQMDHRHHNRSVMDTQYTSAVIVQETPELGPVILRGPPHSHEYILGGTWNTIRGVFNAFPCVTGRTKELNQLPKRDYRDMPGFTWRGKNKGTTHPRLSKGLYRKRTQAWRAIERALGWDPLWGTIELRPRGVLMAPPPKKSLIDAYSL